jgi:hypothetical protein
MVINRSGGDYNAHIIINDILVYLGINAPHLNNTVYSCFNP